MDSSSNVQYESFDTVVAHILKNGVGSLVAKARKGVTPGFTRVSMGWSVLTVLLLRL